MNKILPYIIIAILLGTVTMVVPYLLLGPSDYTSMTEGSKLIQPSPSGPTQSSAPIESTSPAPTLEPTPVPPSVQEERANAEGGDMLNGDSSTPVPAESTEPPPASTPSSEPTSVPSPSPEPSAEASELASTKSTNLITESLSVLSPIVLMTIPSFLIALGVFIYLKKQRT